MTPPHYAQFEAIKVETNLLEDYAGRNALTPNFVLAISCKGGQIFAQATG